MVEFFAAKICFPSGGASVHNGAPQIFWSMHMWRDVSIAVKFLTHKQYSKPLPRYTVFLGYTLYASLPLEALQ